MLCTGQFSHIELPVFQNVFSRLQFHENRMFNCTASKHIKQAFIGPRRRISLFCKLQPHLLHTWCTKYVCVHKSLSLTEIKPCTTAVWDYDRLVCMHRQGRWDIQYRVGRFTYSWTCPLRRWKLGLQWSNILYFQHKVFHVLWFLYWMGIP